MPLHPTWIDLTLRLAYALGASAVIGFNREARGHAAGLRTTILVGIAACVSMIQANVLLTVGGHGADSFGSMDLMRLPLGILTGVGFIGGGAILRRGDLVTGVTTAATMWMTTVIGLCFGGGQYGLGAAATGVAVFTLGALKHLDIAIVRERRGRLVIRTAVSPTPPDLMPLLIGLPYRATFQRRVAPPDSNMQHVTYDITWRARESAAPPADLLQRLSTSYDVDLFEIRP